MKLNRKWENQKKNKKKSNHDITLSSNTVKTAQKENQDGGRRWDFKTVVHKAVSDITVAS